METGALFRRYAIAGALALLALPASAHAEWSADGTGGAVVVSGNDDDDDYVEGNVVLSSFTGVVWNVFNTNGQNHGAMTNGCSANGAQLWSARTSSR